MTDTAPLEVELLASEDARRLRTALGAQRPITVAQHQAFRATIATPPAVDPIDELLAELRKPAGDHSVGYHSRSTYQK